MNQTHQYAELPTPNLPRGGFPDLFTAEQMRDFADRTHTLRTRATPFEAIEALLNQAMDQATAKGASMPDEVVEVAYWLVHPTVEQPMKKPKVVLELPDGDDRAAVVFFSEMKGDTLHLCIHVTGQAAPKTASGDEGKALAALRYYMNECSGAEPSISVFHRMVEEALEAAPQQGAGSELLETATRNLKYFIERAQFSSFADKQAALNCLDALGGHGQPAGPSLGSGKACVCGESQAPGTIHRVDGPCYVATPQQAGPTAWESAAHGVQWQCGQQTSGFAAPRLEPAMYVSPKQFAALIDPDGEHGRYLPVRKTRAGLFTQPLYTTPQPTNKEQTMTEPTDAEIIALAVSEGIKVRTGASAVKLVRAALANWGTPQPAPAHPACKSDMLVNGGALVLALSVLRRAGKTEVADELEKTAQPAPPSDDVVRDAARYRWLRDTSNADDPTHMIALHIRDEQNDASLSGIDAAIDAAIATQGNKDA